MESGLRHGSGPLWKSVPMVILDWNSDFWKALWTRFAAVMCGSTRSESPLSTRANPNYGVYSLVAPSCTSNPRYLSKVHGPFPQTYSGFLEQVLVRRPISTALHLTVMPECLTGHVSLCSLLTLPSRVTPPARAHTV